MDDAPPDDLTARRAERARRNGRHSRGPVSERGKARSSRNALRHGLTAKVHLVLDRDDEAEFMALAGGLEGELAPRGTLEAFLVARLTAAMWHTGRAERMEARAFAAAADPDPDRLRLALRYRGSVQRELFRCLRALQELRCRPFAFLESDAGSTAEPERPAVTPEIVDPARVAVAAWGGERAGPIPPGFLELRPVPQIWPVAWRFVQDRAYPGDVPLLVYADGTVRSPDGRLLEDVWSPEAPPSPLLEPSAPPAMPTESATKPVPAVEPASALASLDDEEVDDLLLTPQRRNEPTQPFVSAGISDRPLLPDTGPPIPQIGLGRTAPELGQMPAGDHMQPAPEAPGALGGNMSQPQDGPETSRLQTETRNPVHSPRLGVWERMWGITLPDPEPTACADDTSEPDPTAADERNCTIEFKPCTSEPEQAAACTDLCRESAGINLGENGLATAPHRDDPSARPETSDGSDGRPGQLRRRNPRLARRRYASHPEDDP